MRGWHSGRGLRQNGTRWCSSWAQCGVTMRRSQGLIIHFMFFYLSGRTIYYSRAIANGSIVVMTMVMVVRMIVVLRCNWLKGAKKITEKYIHITCDYCLQVKWTYSMFGGIQRRIGVNFTSWLSRILSQESGCTHWRSGGKCPTAGMKDNSIWIDISFTADCCSTTAALSVIQMTFRYR